MIIHITKRLECDIRELVMILIQKHLLHPVLLFLFFLS